MPGTKGTMQIRVKAAIFVHIITQIEVNYMNAIELGWYKFLAMMINSCIESFSDSQNESHPPNSPVH